MTPSSPDKRTEDETLRLTRWYFLFAILSTVFCFLPAVVAFFYTNIAHSEFRRGRDDEADKALGKARRWLLIAVWSGIAFYIILVIIKNLNL